MNQSRRGLPLSSFEKRIMTSYSAAVAAPIVTIGRHATR